MIAAAEVRINGRGLGYYQPVVGAHSIGKMLRNKKVGTFGGGYHVLRRGRICAQKSRSGASTCWEGAKQLRITKGVEGRL